MTGLIRGASCVLRKKYSKLVTRNSHHATIYFFCLYPHPNLFKEVEAHGKNTRENEKEC